MAHTPDTLRKKALEMVYYSGPAESGNSAYWQQHAASQEAYMELCQRGHTLIANQIIEGVRNGHPPTVKELYQTAARVRRAMAIINQSQSPQCLQFGQPLATNGNNQLRDIIRSEGENRFKEHFGTLREDFHRILGLVQNGTFKDAFGKEYSAKTTHADHETRITISRTDPKAEVATLALSDEGNKIVLMHAKVKDRDTLFAKADMHLQHILGHREMDESHLCRNWALSA
jgi:hypothetical protein